VILPRVERGQIVEGSPDVGMVWPKRFFRQHQRPLEQRLGLGIAALPLIERGEVVQLRCDRRRIEADRFLHDRDRALVQGFGIGVPADAPVKLRQIVQRAGKIPAGGALREVRHQSLRQRNCFGIFSGAAEILDLRALRRQALR